MPKLLIDKLPIILLLVVPILLLSLLHLFSAADLLQSRQNFDRHGLEGFFEPGSFDNDVVLDTFLLRVQGDQTALSNLHLLNLDRDRLAYIARRGDEAIAVAVPATADDGFNGRIDLLISVDMYGRISAARVIKDVNTTELYGIVDVIDSKWMEQFSGNSMRDILRLSWQPITAENEFDQFVGASITPKSVANQIYDALVFFQSNRIALIRGGG